MPATAQPFTNLTVTGSGNVLTASYGKPSDWSDTVSNGFAQWDTHGSFSNATSSNAAPGPGKWPKSGTYTFYASNLADGETISFRVKHQLKNHNDSSYVSGTYTTPSAATVPNAPGTPTITDIQDTQFTFSWVAVSGATSYKVYGGQSAGPSVNGTLLATQTGNSYTWTSRTANQTYYVAVIATNAVGDSSPSSDRVVKTMVVDPSAPTAAQSTPVQNTISWSNVTGTVKTRLFGGTSSNPTAQLTTVTSGTTSYTHTGLTPGTTYYYRIKQTNDNGETYFSGYSSQDSVATVTLAAPTNITGTPAVTDNTVTFTEAAHSTRTYIYWSATSGGTYNNAYVGTNQAYLTTPTATFNVDDGLESSNGTALLTGDNDVEYIKLKSYISGHYSALSSEYAAYSLPGTPTNLAAAQGSGEGEIDLSWTQTVGSGARTVTYTIERATSSGGTFSTVASSISSGTTTFTDTGLDGSTTFYYRIFASTLSGQSAVSSEVNATTAAATGPNPSNEQLELGKLNVLKNRGADGATVSMNDITGDTNEASFKDFFVGGMGALSSTTTSLESYNQHATITANFTNAGQKFKDLINTSRFSWSLTGGSAYATLSNASGRTVRITHAWNSGVGVQTATVQCVWTPIFNDHLSTTTKTIDIAIARIF